MRRDLIAAAASFIFGLFAVPILVFSGGSLLLAALSAVASIGAGLIGIRSEDRAFRILSIAGFAMGTASLWYTITGWAVSLDIAASIEALF